MLRHGPVLLCVIAGVSLRAFDTDAQPTDCTAPVGDVVMRGDLNIAVACRLTGTDVRGNVTVFAGGSLAARDVRIRGNLEASRADFVSLEGSRVEGDVGLDELVGDASSLERNDLRGDLALRGNRSRLAVLGNDVRGNVLVVGNSGGVTLFGNEIKGDLECTRNSPAPARIANRIGGDAEGQCGEQRPEPQETPPPSDSPPPEPSPPPPSSPPRPSTPPPSATPPSTATPPSSPPPAPSATPAPSPTPPSPPPPSTSSPPTPEPPVTTAPPPAATPPPAPDPSPDVDADADGEGGVGALGWPMALLLGAPLLRRRRARRP